MPQVSRKPLPKDTQDRLFEIFFKSLARISDPSDIQKLLFDLLSPIERTMLAKRLAIAILLAKGYSYEAIKDTIHVSQETIARVNLSLNYGGEGYKMIIQKILRDEKLEHILENIEDATIAILPNSSLKGGLIRHRKTTRKPKTAL
jgi:TrpR-related protein YerC/YecD